MTQLHWNTSRSCIMVLKESCPETIVTFTERRTAVTRTSCAAGEFGPSLLQPETIREFPVKPVRTDPRFVRVPLNDPFRAAKNGPKGEAAMSKKIDREVRSRAAKAAIPDQSGQVRPHRIEKQCVRALTCHRYVRVRGCETQLLDSKRGEWRSPGVWLDHPLCDLTGLIRPIVVDVHIIDLNAKRASHQTRVSSLFASNESFTDDRERP